MDTFGAAPRGLHPVRNPYPAGVYYWSASRSQWLLAQIVVAYARDRDHPIIFDIMGNEGTPDQFTRRVPTGGLVHADPQCHRLRSATEGPPSAPWRPDPWEDSNTSVAPPFSPTEFAVPTSPRPSSGAEAPIDSLPPAPAPSTTAAIGAAAGTTGFRRI